jgi:uncharacterized RDD family membrane protein YckC
MIKSTRPINRVLAASLDSLIGTSIFFLSVYYISTSKSLTEIFDRSLSIVTLITVFCLLLPLMNSYLIYRFQASLGKLLTGLRVVKSDGKGLTFRESLFRVYIGYFFSNVFLALGFIWAFISKDHRTWHDYLQDTFVIDHKPSPGFAALLILIMIVAVIFLIIGSVLNFMSMSSSGFV